MTVHFNKPTDVDGSSADQADRVGKPRILVVDDVADNRDILSRRLVRRGFDVDEAANGAEALDMVSGGDFNLILLDIMMPGMLGTDVVRKIRETLSPSELPIIMVSAKSESEDVAECLELGANDYIVKPVDITVALARIQTQLEMAGETTRERKSRQSAETTARNLQDAILGTNIVLRQTTSQLAAETESRKRSENKLKYLAQHDTMTRIQNRSALLETLSETLGDQDLVKRDPVLIVIDLDRFKAVNDVYGHMIGDRLLCEVSDRLAATFAKDPNTLSLARLGGDEFALLYLSDGDPRAGKRVGQKIIDMLDEPFALEKLQVRVGATCGVARTSICGTKVEALLRAADLAMYQGKTMGRGQVVNFDVEVLEAQRERSFVEIGLRDAIENEQLEVYFQPMIDSSSLQISCFEALVRWNHPERGVIEPRDFISVAEQTGLIVPLGTWVLRAACEAARSWPKHLRVAVNLSPAQFVQPDLVKMIAGVVRDTGIAPERLELEITESCLLDAGERNVSILDELRKLKVRVSIDDFGSGFSSMSYLQNFIFDKLKIDRRFMSDIETNPKTAAIVNAIIQLGNTIGVSTTVEGVETEYQLQTALSQGCDEMQGFLFGAPMPADTVPDFIEVYSRYRTVQPRT